MNNSKISGASLKQDMLYIQNNVENSEASLKQQISGNKGNIDEVSISAKAKILLALEDEENLSSNNNYLKIVKEMLENLQIDSEEENDYFSDRLKCIKIAMRIINGDEVPEKDKKFLAKTDPEMYFKAILLKRQNENAKKYDSVLNDKKTDNAIDTPAIISLESTTESNISSDDTGEIAEID